MARSGMGRCRSSPRLSNIKSVAAGGYHSIALKSDGTISTWGLNSTGQLGISSTVNAKVPVSIATITGVTAISGGRAHSQAIGGSNGTLWSWGTNTYGAIGDNTATNRTAPVTTLLTSGIMSLAAGAQHTLYVKWDGSVWAWGSNASGQIGDGPPLTKRLIPVQVSSLSGITSVAAGPSYSLALASNGTVFAWGLNNYGQLGDGTFTNRSLPTLIPGLSGIVAIAAGATHALALRYDGKVYAWGRNHLGQLGDETQIDRSTPGLVSYLDKAVAIGAGASHSLAIHQNGTAYTWGSGEDGQLCDFGSGSGHISSVITQIPGITKGVGVAAGAKHSLLLEANGNTWACGDNQYGQLGNGSTTDSSSPVLVANLTNAVRIVAGGGTSAALSTGGTVYTWGLNNHGQLGDGTQTSRTTVAPIPSFSGVAAVAVGASHAVAAKTDSSAYVWGCNDSGQIGDGTLANRLNPTAALLP
jgi:alpha-tubulin suppressor-like RCC1 family protein